MRRLSAVLRVLGAAGLCWLWLVQTGCSDKTPLGREQAVVLEARQAFLDGRYAAAEAAYQTYLQRFATGRYRREAWQRLADIRVAAGEPLPPTLTLLETAALEWLGEQPVAAAFLEQAGHLAMEHGDYDQATGFFQKVLDLTRASPRQRLDAYLQLAHIRTLARDTAGALDVLRHCRGDGGLPDGVPECVLAMAETALEAGRVAEAEPDLDKVLANPANDPALRVNAGLRLARLYEKQHEITKARDVYDRLLSFAPYMLLVKSRLESLGKASPGGVAR